MGRGKGIAGIIAFAFLTMMSISFVSITSELETLAAEAAMVICIISILVWATGFLIPGIFCLIEYEAEKKVIFLYMIVPCTILCFLIYTMIIAMVAPTSFMSNFQEFLVLGIGASIVLGIIVACISYAEAY